MITEMPKISISIVSHNNGVLIKNLLSDLRRTLNCSNEILLTINVPEDVSFINDFADLNLTVVTNDSAKGFGANHNAAFARASGQFFLIVNPDIRLVKFDFNEFIEDKIALGEGALSPLIKNSAGELEDSARFHPTFLTLVMRFFTKWRKDCYTFTEKINRVDWLAGMYICFDRHAFCEVGGFDEGYFMYLEDADIGRKMSRAGYGCFVAINQCVIHDAQRASKRSVKHLKWHVMSAFRYFSKHGY